MIQCTGYGCLYNKEYSRDIGYYKSTPRSIEQSRRYYIDNPNNGIRFLKIKHRL